MMTLVKARQCAVRVELLAGRWAAAAVRFALLSLDTISLALSPPSPSQDAALLEYCRRIVARYRRGEAVSEDELEFAFDQMERRLL